MDKRRRPRLTKAVREGLREIRAYVVAELECPEASQFTCRRFDPETGEAMDCGECDGCVALKNALSGVAWLDGLLARYGDG